MDAPLSDDGSVSETMYTLPDEVTLVILASLPVGALARCEVASKHLRGCTAARLSRVTCITNMEVADAAGALLATKRALPALLALRLAAPYFDVHTVADVRDRLSGRG